MRLEKPGYAYIWQYSVDPACVEDFKHAYGPDGPWVRLFRRATGYARTELFQDTQDPLRFLTIDYWESLQAYENFRVLMAAEYKAIDRQCENLTREEKELGSLLRPGGQAG